VGGGRQIRDLPDETCDGDKGLPKRCICHEELDRIWLDTSVGTTLEDSIKGNPEKPVLPEDAIGPGIMGGGEVGVIPDSEGLCGTFSDDLSLGKTPTSPSSSRCPSKTGNEVSFHVNLKEINKQHNENCKNENRHVTCFCRLKRPNISWVPLSHTVIARLRQLLNCLPRRREV